jgi:hypothetical protein
MPEKDPEKIFMFIKVVAYYPQLWGDTSCAQSLGNFSSARPPAVHGKASDSVWISSGIS